MNMVVMTRTVAVGISVASALLTAAAACSSSTDSGGDGLRVVAAFYPLAWMAEQVAGDRAVRQRLGGIGDELVVGRVRGIGIVRRQLVRVEPGSRDHGEDAPGLRLDRDDGTLETVQCVVGRPLRRGVEPDDVVGALRYLIDAPCLTGQVLLIDSGHRFLALGRDVQFLEEA